MVTNATTAAGGNGTDLQPGQNHDQTAQTAEQVVSSSLPHRVPAPPEKGAVAITESASHTETASASAPRRSFRKRIVLGIVGVAVAGAAAVFVIPVIVLAFTTISTDDAYVNGHVTFVAARVPGQVSRVLVDDNVRVRKGDLLVQLDKEPNQVQVDLAKAKVETAKAQLQSAQAQANALAGKARSTPFLLENTIEEVNNNVALLRAKVAGLETNLATLRAWTNSSTRSTRR